MVNYQWHHVDWSSLTPQWFLQARTRVKSGAPKNISICTYNVCNPRVSSETTRNLTADLGEWRAAEGEPPFNKLRLYHISRPTAGHYGRCEGLQLADCIINWLDITYLNNPTIQSQQAMSQLRETIDGYMDDLNVVDLRQRMTTKDIANLMRRLNAVFFANTIPFRRLGSPPIRWTTDNNTLGECEIDENYSPTIFLHPCMVQDYDKRLYPVQSQFRAYDRLNTLLHELCHAFILVYIRQAEHPCNDELGMGGHGTAWQMVAAKVEEVADKALGMSLDLDRVLGLMLDRLRMGSIWGGLEEWEQLQFDKTMVGRGLRWTPELLKPATLECARAMKGTTTEALECDTAVMTMLLRVLNDSWIPV